MTAQMCRAMAAVVALATGREPAAVLDRYSAAELMHAAYNAAPHWMVANAGRFAQVADRRRQS